MARILILILLANGALADGDAAPDGTVFGGVRIVGPNQFLDLDNGGLFPRRDAFPGGAAEIRYDQLLVKATEDAAMAEAAPKWSDAAWNRVTTSDGNTSWVQVLRREKAAALRFYTRLGGKGEPLPAPVDPYCIGLGRVIRIYFRPSKVFAEYRIERRASQEHEYRTIATVKEAPYLDMGVDREERYAYRIRGVTADGRSGIPASLSGTSRSRGAFAGRVGWDTNGAASFDFLRGKFGDDGDITLLGTAGGRSAAMFRDATGQPVRAVDPVAAHGRSAWAHQRTGSDQLESGAILLIALRGGGVARCTVTMGQRREGPAVFLDYEVNPDGYVLPEPPVVHVKKTDGGIEVSADIGKGQRVSRILGRELVNEKGPWNLEVTRNTAVDKGAQEGEVREYEVYVVDAFGRNLPPGRGRLSLRSNRIVRGEFHFHYKQGYSFLHGRVVDPRKADVYFQTCAGGISSISLTAPGGSIVTLASATGERGLGPTSDELLDSIVRVQPDDLRFEPSARCDNRRPAADVIIAKTRNGGWVKMAITHRGNEGGWQQNLATLRYVYNPREPVFEGDAADTETKGGVVLRRTAPAK